MFIIVTEAVPDRLRGYLSRWLLQIRAGVFIGEYSVRVRERLWEVVCREVGSGNVVMAWSVSNEAGFDFCTVGSNARNPAELDGMKLVEYWWDDHTEKSLVKNQKNW